MAEDHDFKAKKPSSGRSSGKTKENISPRRDIYDPQILGQVTTEIEVEKKEQKKAGEWVPLPDLPPPPPRVSPIYWFLRQLKRFVVIFVCIYLVVWVIGTLRHKYRLGYPATETRTGLVPLPKSDSAEAKVEQTLTETLNEARSDLASSNTKSGLEALIDLAEGHPDTMQGRKAMLTLASTYRYQFNQPEESIRWYRKYLEVDPNGKEAPATMIRLGTYFEDLGRKAEARAVYEDLLKRFPDKPQAVTAKQGIARTK